MEETSTYISNFEKFETSLRDTGPSWIQNIRRGAISRFVELGFPTTRHEEWKYTSLAPLTRIPFQPAAVDLNGARSKLVASLGVKGIEAQLVFVNGHFSHELSQPQYVPTGVKLGSLARILESDPESVEPYLARHVSYDGNPFVALNTAFMRDGAVIVLPDGTVIPQPIHLLFISNAPEEPTVSHPRNLIVVGRGCQVTIVESYLGLPNQVYFTNPVTEIITGDESIVEHYKLQQESQRAFHLATLEIHAGLKGTFASHSISVGGSLVRNDINAVLDREGTDCTLNGLYLTTGRQHVDNHTNIDHAKPHCTSRELYKGILDGKSSGVFDGKIQVRKDAQKTNAKQTNKNLLLSKHALVNTKPQLEILADDVKCTHGATIGQLDDDALFYMRTRGIDREAARNLLIYAFASEIAAGLKVEAIRAHVERILMKQMPGEMEYREDLV